MAITTAIIGSISAWAAAHAAAIAITSAVIALGSTALGVTSAVVQGNQQKAIANYQRQVNEQNAKASREAAQAKIENQRRAAKFTYGTQLARLGGMGALAEGSPLDIMGQSAGQQEYDNIVTEYEGEVQAIQFQQQAALNKYEADIAQYNMGLNITNQVLKGASKVGNSLLGAGAAFSQGNSLANTGDFSTPTGELIDVGRDDLTGVWTA
jgi:hypothetical protein